MDEKIKDAVNVANEKYRKPTSNTIQYGTAGFRAENSGLDYVLYRMGLLAALRSKSQSGRCIGVMITASHNAEQDNGVKLIDPMGEMLAPAWEKYASRLASVSDDQLAVALRDIIDAADVDVDVEATVAIARDTRPSSPRLSDAAICGINVFNAKCINYGLLTTPQLHYMVRCVNTAGGYGEPTEAAYYSKLATAFHKLTNKTNRKNYKPSVYVDGANGIGALKLAEMKGRLQGALCVEIYNDGSKGKLNDKCGADFVKVQQMAPDGLQMAPSQRYASFDGDADRIVYFYASQDGQFHLMDGDKIATLVAGYLKDLVAESGLQLNFGLVQTAYANGSSTNYINGELKVAVACVATGVKHLHHAACDYDIGVYFEANGHGTVLFSDQALEKVKSAAADKNIPAANREAATRLVNVIDLINQTVGDAISDMLLVETILCSRDWDIADWDAVYADLPNRQLKVRVADRSVIQTTDAERKCSAPAGLQVEIDAIVAEYKQSRSFVRPSGTEDMVRVYAEADTQENADELAQRVSSVVSRLAGGLPD